MLRFLVVALILSAGTSLHFDSQIRSAEITYDEYMRLAPEARVKRFRTADANDKALLKRTHAQRWLQRNRVRLSPEQITAIDEAIAFITPEIYRSPNHPEIRKREETIQRNLTCMLGRENTIAAFVLDPPPSKTPASWRSTVDAWLSWFSECVVG